MQVRIENITERKLIGMKTKMSFDDNKTSELWRDFMSKRFQIQNAISTNLFSIEVYPSVDYFKEFDSKASFDKWAAVEVADFTNIPLGFDVIKIPQGLYAVFTYVGSANEGFKAYQYIYGTWIPNSTYKIDDRPHFALMGEKYKNNDPSSEEEIWIPIK